MSLHSSNSPGKVCLTCGDPAGVGPELVAQALPHILSYGRQPLLLMPPELLKRAQQLTGLQVPFTVAPPDEPVPPDRAHIWFPVEVDSDVVPGEVSQRAGELAQTSLETAVQLVRKDPSIPLVTAPVNKQALHLAGFDYPGQTEFLGARDGDQPTWMIMHHDSISVVLTTIHLPLMEVGKTLTVARLLDSCRALHSFLQHLNLEEPLTMLALNPHAAEGGLFGSEEQEIIIPAIQEAVAGGLPVRGPLSADTAFGGSGRYVAMYHDQAMIPFKIKAGWEGVNVTWGLSFYRTSPDHGTAFPLAWRNRVDPASMLAAVELAMRLTA